MTNIGEAKFVAGSDGDYCLLAGSRLVDRGEPAAATRLDGATSSAGSR